MNTEAIALALILAGLTLANAAHATAPDNGETEYRRALSLNEQGRGKEALPLFSELKDKYPAVLRYRFDYAAVASGSGEHAQALAAVDDRLEAYAPRYALEALFRSAIALADQARAEGLHARLAGRLGPDVGRDIRLTHLYLQLGHAEKALALSADLVRRAPQQQEVLDLRAYALRQAGQPGEALLVYQEIERLFPDNREAPKAIGMILAELGAPTLSATRLQSQAIPLDTADALRLTVDRGVQHLRWAPGDPDAPAEHFRNTDLAISTLVAARDEAMAREAAPAALARLRGDLVVAYHARRRWPEAIAEYEAVVAGGQAAPAYVELTAASSYASAGQYRRAEAMLRQLAARTPDSFEINSAWIYALSDVEYFDEGDEVSRKLVAALARTDRSNPAKAEAYTSARLIQAMLFAYRGRYAEAQRCLDELQAAAPGSQDAIEAAGTLAGWRGQPRKAEDQFRIALGEQPRRIDSRLGLANARFDRGDAAPLRLILDDHGLTDPEQRSVREARRRLELHDSAYVVGNATFGSDQESVAGNRTREFDLKAYSRPFADDRWRAFARNRDLWSGPVVATTANNLSAGLKHSALDWTTELEAGTGGYARVETAYALSDQWSAGLSVENNVFFRQARAVEAGVQADTAALSLRWRQDESFDIAGGYRFTGFSNNQRSEAYVTATRSLYADFARRLSLGARLAGQRNSDPDVAYFSPTRQVEATGTLNVELRQWQDMATKKSSLWHRLWLTAGTVDQAGFGAHWMNNIGYGQEFALSDSIRIRWSIARTRYPFDGVTAAYYTGNLGFEGYF